LSGDRSGGRSLRTPHCREECIGTSVAAILKLADPILFLFDPIYELRR
jgi:hypothetical protein